MVNLPDKIYLTALKRQWEVSYVDSPGKLILIEHPHGEIALYGKNYSKSAALHVITRWMRLKAHDYLCPLLDKLNKKVKVNYKKIVVKSHDSRWGSYSTTGTINLNYKLIFLPPALVKHLIYHELCHSYTLNHSEKFWNKLALYDRNWKKHKAALYDGDDYIPEWVIY